MYMHRKEYEIRYTDVDFADRLKLSSLLSFLEESACFSADELGFGYADLKPKNYAFILAGRYVEFIRPVVLGEKLTVCTWPIKAAKLAVFRDFNLFVGDEKVGAATSRWCVVNLSDFSFISPAEVISPDTEYNDFRSVNFSFPKIPAVCDGEFCYRKAIRCSDYDHYSHANNTKYGDYVSDAFSVKELFPREIASVQISYIGQCREGDDIDVFRKYDGGGAWRVEGCVGGEARFRAKVIFRE